MNRQDDPSKAHPSSSGNQIDRAYVRQAIVTVSDRVADMIRGLPDTGTPVPGSDWTVGDTVSHLIAHLQLDAQLVAGGVDSPFTGRESFFTDGRARSSLNDGLLSNFPQRVGGRLAELLVGQTRSFLEAGSNHPENRPARYHYFRVDWQRSNPSSCSISLSTPTTSRRRFVAGSASTPRMRG